MTRMSAAMGWMIPGVLLLITSGAVSGQVINGKYGGSVYFYESVPIQINPAITWNFKNSIIAQRFPSGTPVCIIGRCELSENGTLRLDSLVYEDEGEYTMTAQYSNSTLIKKSTYELKVYPILSAPVLSSNETIDRLINGTYVSLHCDAGNQSVTAYTFYHDGKNICSDVTCKDSHLYFQPITETDSGNYTCTIQNPVSSKISNTLQLSVTVPVSDVKLTSNVSGLVWPGLDSVSLTCSASGTDIKYTWQLQGAPLPNDPSYHFSENNKVLTISPVTAKDNGTFTCTVGNWVNNETSNGEKFSLASKISEVTLSSNASESGIWVGEESASFHCSADGSAVTFHWKLNGTSLPPDSQYNVSQGDSPPHSNLLISPVSRNDTGPFTCEASNRLGNKTSNALNLSLLWRPDGDILCLAESVAQDVELICSWSGGQPAANVSLNFAGNTKNGTDRVTMLGSEGGNSQGSTLSCLGDQLGRTAECTVDLKAPDAPGHNNNAITESEVGQAISLTVTLVPGLPANFTWYYLNPDQVPIKTTRAFIVASNSSSSTLQITDVTKENAGRYECNATNIIGTQSFFFNVTVTEPTKGGGLDGGAIAGIVIGVSAGVGLIAILLFFILKKK